MQNWCSESVPKCFCHHLLRAVYTRPTDATPMDVLAVLELHPTPRELTLASLRGGGKSLSGFNDPVPVWSCTFWQLAEVICVDLPYSCVIKIGKSLWRDPMTLHLLSSTRPLSCASCFNSSHDAVTSFQKLEEREMQGKEVRMEQGGGDTSPHGKPS